MNFINKNFKLEKYSDPFPHIIIENFLNLEFYNKIEKSFPLVSELESQKNIVGRMNFDTTYGDEVYESYCARSKEFKIFHEWVYSKDFIDYFIGFFFEDFKNEHKNNFLFIDVMDIQKRDALVNPRTCNQNRKRRFCF